MADFLNLHPNPNARTRHLMAETRDLKMCSPANHPVSGFPSSYYQLPWVGLTILGQPFPQANQGWGTIYRALFCGGRPTSALGQHAVLTLP